MMGAANSKVSSETDADIRNVRQLCQSFTMECRGVGCGAPLVIDESSHIAQWLSKSKVIPPTSQISELFCVDCDLATCAGCGRQPKIGQANVWTQLGVINHCCNRGRLFGIWFLLARFDQNELQKLKSEPTKTIKKEKHKGPATSGVGYGGFDFDDDYDYGFPMYAYNGNYASTAILKDTDEEIAADKLMIETLRLLAPSLAPADNFTEEELSLISLSFLLDRLSDLLRNDSIEDMTSRSDLYLEAFSFLQALSGHPKLLTLLTEERPRKLNSPGLRELGFPTTASCPQEIYSKSETSPSLFECGKNTYRVAKYYVELVTTPKSGEKLDDKSILSLELCNRFIKVHEQLNTKVMAQVAKHDIEPSETWLEYNEENRVMFTDEVLKTHRYHRDFSGVQTSGKGRLNTINKEIATMMTSLPNGIFLKIADSRSDVMKFLILGVEGSPYAGGLFIFDMFLPSNYPRVPPQISFVLSGNDEDMAPFNPNLHVGGTVCLSLINTWSGTPDQQWQPYKSTILSVLISIQAMILGAPLPWLNEPGRERWANHKEAIQHNQFLQVKTVRHAIIAWASNEFNDTKAKEYIWKDIAKTHLRFNGRTILDTVELWASDNKELLHYYKVAKPSKRQKLKAGHNKAKQAAVNEDANEPVPELNLLKQLTLLLGFDYQEEPAPPQIPSIASSKRKASSSGSSLAQDTKNQGVWVYTSAKTQKEVRKACKEFGIGAASTIVGTITKLEKHVNEKGKVSEDLVAKWGKTVLGPSLSDSTISEEAPESMMEDSETTGMTPNGALGAALSASVMSIQKLQATIEKMNTMNGM